MEVFDKINQWASDRNLILGSTPPAQMLKLTEELGELAASIAKKKPIEEVSDAIGDMTVVLTIIASQFGLDIKDCINGAYDEIKDRKGRMENGVFIRDVN